MIEIHIAVFLFGLAGLFGKFLSASPLIIVFGRVSLATLALLITIKISKLTISLLKSYLFLVFSLGILLSIHWLSFFHSIQISTVAIGLISYSSFPVFTVFLEPLFFKEKLDKINIIIAIIAFSGVVLLVPEFEIKNRITQGVIFGLLSGITFSVLSIFNRKLTNRFSSLLIAFYEDLSASIFLFPFMFLIELKPLALKDLALLSFLGVFCTAIAHTLFIKGMRRVKAQVASIIATLEPVYGIILAVILLKEIPSLRTISGGILIVLSALFVTSRKGKCG